MAVDSSPSAAAAAAHDPGVLTGLLPSDTGFVSSTCRPVRRSESAHEWGAVEWAIQCIYRASAKVGLCSLWAVEHPELNRAFDASLARAGSEARESSFVTSVEAAELPPRLPIRRVAQHGFAGVRSFRVHLGNRRLPEPQDLTRRSGVNFFEIVLCRVRLGHTKVHDNGRPPPAAVTGQYDSCLILDDQEQPLYLVKDAQSQLLPVYVARVRVMSSGESGSSAANQFDGRPPPALLQGLPCDICETNCSTLWCVNDQAKLCKECDYRLHEVERLGDPDHHSRSEELLRHMRESSMIIRQRHVRVPINERPGMDPGVCHLLPAADGAEAPPAAWWDRKLEIPVSSVAKSEQYPSNVDETRLQPLASAYQEGVAAESNRRNFLLSLLREIDSLGAQLERESSVSVDSRIRTVHSHAMQKLSFHCEKVMTDLLTAEESAQNHLNVLKWAKEVASPQQQIMTPKAWLELWMEHYRLVKELAESMRADTSLRRELVEPSPMVERCSMQVGLSADDGLPSVTSRTNYSNR
ncbi:Cyclin-dependent kinase 8 [Perkinsus olseni]|uniref:Cyclin-dependent kinase 8 n=1 Tax=Perkinsus olseni TaxID=32597 RepID=A0A7J6NR12_PEROL|nr:Cyclin-dependent kinase 8 [Perkinsus olseni]